MPQCYLIAVTQASALDKATNNWSLFNLIEQVSVPTVPIDLAMEVHIQWLLDDADVGQPLEMRVLLEMGGIDEYIGPPFPFGSAKRRHRLRMVGVHAPRAGDFLVRVDWRRGGEDRWIRERALWPLTVSLIEAESVQLPLLPTAEPG